VSAPDELGDVAHELVGLTSAEAAALEEITWLASGPKSASAIGDRLGISRQRVEQICKRGLRKLKFQMRPRGDYLD